MNNTDKKVYIKNSDCKYRYESEDIEEIERKASPKQNSN